MYKPSSNWLADALRGMAEAYSAVLHLYALSEQNENIRQIIKKLNEGRRMLATEIAKHPEYNPKLTCAALKHIPTALHIVFEVNQAINTTETQEAVYCLKEAQSLIIQELLGDEWNVEGCYECLNEVGL